MPSTTRIPRPLEHWVADAGNGDVAHLDIPADASGDRLFEVSCTFVVSHRGGDEAFHGLRVLVDGRQQWSREVPTHAGGQDSLDVSFRRSVPVGVPLRISAIGSVRGAVRIRLNITAEEQD
ncbi:hypothetical protein M8A51_17130 [Schlegelella sp. S2-27]|uniref:Uncharacterized protein n=1 Tax=Caldimonas mangrovi TaxID=2944811 RepID=A0ABT0YRI8_9BURK|nr:hypothetical protein [Caldimonas mangrovi]MCM5681253.1 hypothetical protein [Caldimonas mangrovi]